MTIPVINLSELAAADFICACGRRHRTDIKEIHLDGPVLEPLTRLIHNQTSREGQLLRPGHSRILLIADQNTWQAAGQVVQGDLQVWCDGDAAYPVDTCIFPAEPVLVPDEHAVFAVIRALRPETGLMVAIGSGTLNDLTRFVSSRTGIPYYIVATAPSMDGYASSVAPMIVNQMKVTVDACGAAAILGDPSVLAASPAIMLAAGLGDILGKYSAICDWRMGALVTDEYYCEDIARQVLETVESCRRQARRLGDHDPDAARIIMEGLILSGILMSQAGNSRPASGAEHHLSHFWEMSLLRRQRPPVLHGSKVGLASIMICDLYHHLLEIKPDFPAARKRLTMMDHQEWQRNMKLAYQEGAAELFELDLRSGKNDPKMIARRIDLLEEKWPQLCLMIQQTIPDPESIRRALIEAGGVSDPEQLGIDHMMVADAVRYAREMRDRYTVLQLYADLGLTDQSIDLVLRHTF